MAVLPEMFSSRRDFAWWLDRLTAEGGVDFHLHSTCSDGAKTPAEVGRDAADHGLRAFSLTDHDTMAGVADAEKAAGDAVVCVPGIECTAYDQETELHILGYFTERRVEAMEAFLERRRRDRQERNRKMVEKLRALGYPVDMERLASYGGSGNASIGRVHMALWLVDHGHFASVPEAFSALLANGKPAYVPRPRYRVSDVVKTIRNAEGVAVLAHPAQYGWCRFPEHPSTRAALLKRLTRCKEAGMDGVECFHGDATKEERRLLYDVSTRLSLIRTAGSDDHGRTDTHTPMYSATTVFM